MSNSLKVVRRLLLRKSRNKIMLDLLIALVIGMLLGIVSGLLPGLHPNNVIPIILGLSFLFAPLSAAIILVVCGVVNIFMNFIPTIFLGAPDDDNVLSVLPGHKLLLQGRGYEAVKLSVIGSFGGMIFAVLTLPIFAFFVPGIYSLMRPYVHWLLIAAVSFMIFKEKNRFFAIVVFILSGVLGYVVLNFYSSNMLFPLLSGLFGLPNLLISFKSKTKLPDKNSLDENKMGSRDVFSSVTIGSLAGIVAGLLPGLGSAQSTFITQQVFKKKDKDGRSFLMSIGSVAMSDIIYSILALWLIGNPRSGIAVAVGELLEVNMNIILVIISAIIISSAFALLLTLEFSKKALGFLRKIDYSKLSLYIFVMVMVLAAVFSGIVGIIIALISLAIGLIPNYMDVRRTNCMGCLILPTILFFMGI